MDITNKLLLYLNKATTIFACCLFLISFLCQFLTVSYQSDILKPDVQISYWSYKTVIKFPSFIDASGEETQYFTEYWFAEKKPYSYYWTPHELDVQQILIAMLLMQTFTLASGFATLFLHGKDTKLLPLVSNVVVASLMTCVMIRVQNAYNTYLPQYELGYWFTIASATLFLFTFIESLFL